MLTVRSHFLHRFNLDRWVHFSWDRIHQHRTDSSLGLEMKATISPGSGYDAEPPSLVHGIQILGQSRHSNIGVGEKASISSDR